MISEKTCSKCKKDRPVTQFYRGQRSADGLSYQCKDCDRQNRKLWAARNKEHLRDKAKERYRANPAAARERSRRWRERHPDRYELALLRQSARNKGLDPSFVASYFREHNGVCDICMLPPVRTGRIKKRLSIDHDHETGRFRGLLCSDCNTALGFVHDDVKILESAITYLLRTAS